MHAQTSSLLSGFLLLAKAHHVLVSPVVLRMLKQAPFSQASCCSHNPHCFGKSMGLHLLRQAPFSQASCCRQKAHCFGKSSSAALAQTSSLLSGFLLLSKAHAVFVSPVVLRMLKQAPFSQASCCSQNPHCFGKPSSPALAQTSSLL